MSEDRRYCHHKWKKVIDDDFWEQDICLWCGAVSAIRLKLKKGDKHEKDNN